MELDKLILLNKNIKRRLVEKFKGDVCMFRDGRNRVVNAKPIGLPHSISVSEVEDPFNDERIKGTPYHISKDDISGFLTEDESALALGTDYFTGAEPVDIHAMLKACTGGPGLANAYVLGGNYHYGHMKRPFVVVPIQYYSIPKEIYDSLALTEKEIKKISKQLQIAA